MGRLEQLKLRILRNAKVQEGEKPAENPAVLIEQAEQIASELTRLIQRINATNSSTKLAEGQSIAAAIAVRDVLRFRVAIYRELAQAATVTQDRYTKSEVKFQSTVNIAEMQRRADELALEHRDLDAKIQAANWDTDLIE